jgi:hypothetical protein
LARDETAGGVPTDEWAEWRRCFREHLDRYGYAIYDMDMAKPLPMEEPAPILETLKMYIAGQGQDPHERQRAYAERREQALQNVR